MVYAFIIHTLLPGSCKVLFYNVYGNDNATLETNNDIDTDNAAIRRERRQQIQHVADQVR